MGDSEEQIPIPELRTISPSIAPTTIIHKGVATLGSYNGTESTVTVLRPRRSKCEVCAIFCIVYCVLSVIVAAAVIIPVYFYIIQPLGLLKDLRL